MVNLKKVKLKKEGKFLNDNRGITLIALVITIIVLLILAGISIATLTGDNGLLTKASDAKIKTVNANVFEQLQIEEMSYITDKTAGTTTKSLVEYLKDKLIITAIDEENGIWLIDVEKLLGSKQSLGNGTYPNDVYTLEQENPPTGSLINTKMASTTPIKVAAAPTIQITYKVVYHGNGLSDSLTLGNLSYNSNSTVVVSDESTKLYDFYKTKNFEFVETTQSIDGKNAEYIFRNLEAYSAYVLYDGNIYKVSYESTNITVTGVVKVSSNADFTTFGVYTIDGNDVLVTPGKEKIVHEHRTFSSYYYLDEDGNMTDVPFTSGYYADGEYYDDSGALVHVGEIVSSLSSRRRSFCLKSKIQET